MDNLICMDLCCCSVAEAKQYLGEQVCVCVCVCLVVRFHGGEVSKWGAEVQYGLGEGKYAKALLRSASSITSTCTCN